MQCHYCHDAYFGADGYAVLAVPSLYATTRLRSASVLATTPYNLQKQNPDQHRNNRSVYAPPGTPSQTARPQQNAKQTEKSILEDGANIESPRRKHHNTPKPGPPPPPPRLP